MRLAVEGPAIDQLALHGAGDWPLMRYRVQTTDHMPTGPVTMTSTSANVPVPGGLISIDRRSSAIVLCCSEPTDRAAVVHPCLWPAAAVHARWSGWDALHAGSVAVAGDGPAWIVLGHSGSGKSTLLAHLALEGMEIGADDLAVVAGDRVLAGPRCIDVKPDAATRLGAGGRLRPVRWSQRLRLPLEPATAERQIAGFIELEWNEHPRVTEPPPSARFSILMTHRRVSGLGVDPELILELAARPMIRLVRRRGWTGSASALSLIRNLFE